MRPKNFVFQNTAEWNQQSNLYRKVILEILIVLEFQDTACGREISDIKCEIFCKVLFSVTWKAPSAPSEWEISRESKRGTVLYLAGKYCFMIIQVTCGKAVSIT